MITFEAAHHENETYAAPDPVVVAEGFLRMRKDRQPRIPMLERDQVSAEVGALYDALIEQRGVVPNMFKTIAHTPALALGFGRF